MANRYGYQYNTGFKPKMVNIEGFVSIGTGGLVNAPDAYPIPTGYPNGVLQATGVLGSTGLPRGLLPGCATAGVPTGWQGGFSGCIGLLNAGVAGVMRVGTGLYDIILSDDYVRLDSCQVLLDGAALSDSRGTSTGILGFDWNVLYHTVGYGNTVTTGTVTPFVGSTGLMAPNLKNQILIQFSQGPTGVSTGVNAGSVANDLPINSGFWIALRLRDSLSGVQ